MAASASCKVSAVLHTCIHQSHDSLFITRWEQHDSGGTTREVTTLLVVSKQ